MNNDKYFHFLHCNASRNIPMGSEGCSCPTPEKYYQLEKELKICKDNLNFKINTCDSLLKKAEELEIERDDYKKWCERHAESFIKCIDLLHEYRYALRQCTPFTLTTPRGLNNCEFCHQKKHIEGCDYEKLINFDFCSIKEIK